MNTHPETSGRLIRWAHWYDAFTHVLSLGRIKHLRQQFLDFAQLRPSMSVLDVGCGTGELTLMAKTRVGHGRVVGIDAAPEMIAYARNKAAQAQIAVDIQLQPVERLAFPDSSFDVVLSSLMMHHLPDSLKSQALSEIRRVLKHKGALVIMDFRRPTTRWSHMLSTLVLHKHLATGVQDLEPLLHHAGFTAIDHGGTSGVIGFVRAT